MDAPGSGGAPGAAAGTLTVMVGGSADAVTAARPVFETFANRIVHLGDVGAGQKDKLLNNTLMAANLTVAHHILASADALGVQRDAHLLHKDVRLLGESLDNEAIHAVLQNLTTPVLERMQLP